MLEVRGDEALLGDSLPAGDAGPFDLEDGAEVEQVGRREMFEEHTNTAHGDLEEGSCCRGLCMTRHHTHVHHLASDTWLGLGLDRFRLEIGTAGQFEKGGGSLE